ncbi:MAG: four helix bundle protein [Gemmatimonadaceae bacterium]
MADYRKLKVWQKAHSLSLHAHRAATRIRGQHYAALRSQIIRSASSMPTNIVEGREQKTDPAFARYLRFSISSVSELEYHLLEAKDIEVISASEHHSLSSEVVEVRMMLHGLIRRLEGGEEDDAPKPESP